MKTLYIAVGPEDGRLFEVMRSYFKYRYARCSSKRQQALTDLIFGRIRALIKAPLSRKHKGDEYVKYTVLTFQQVSWNKYKEAYAYVITYKVWKEGEDDEDTS